MDKQEFVGTLMEILMLDDEDALLARIESMGDLKMVGESLGTNLGRADEGVDIVLPYEEAQQLVLLLSILGRAVQMVMEAHEEDERQREAMRQSARRSSLRTLFDDNGRFAG